MIFHKGKLTEDQKEVLDKVTVRTQTVTNYTTRSSGATTLSVFLFLNHMPFNSRGLILFEDYKEATREFNRVVDVLKEYYPAPFKADYSANEMKITFEYGGELFINYKPSTYGQFDNKFKGQDYDYICFDNFKENDKHEGLKELFSSCLRGNYRNLMVMNIEEDPFNIVHRSSNKNNQHLSQDYIELLKDRGQYDR